MEENIIDRTPCNICTHKEVCSHKIVHAANVKEISAYVDANTSLDTIYVKCSKFSQVSSVFRPRQILDTKDMEEV